MAKYLKISIALVALSIFLVAPATSQATLVFTRNLSKNGLFNPTVFVANDNGSGARQVGAGSNPRVSPDGQKIVYYAMGKGKQPSALMLASASGRTPTKLASGWQDPFVFAWSPDSSRIAVLLGPEVGKQRLTVVDVASGAQQTVANGYFGGVSFSPQGSEQLVYSMAPKEGFPRTPTSTGSTCFRPARPALPR